LSKINVDAAVSRTGVRGAVAALCRNHDGVYLGALAIVYEEISNPSTLEVLACREALALAEDLWLEIYVVSDCSMVVFDIKEGSIGSTRSIVPGCIS
jgi:ribonuclease HI